MTIDDFIHSLIRKRFNLPAETGITWWVEGVNLNGDVEVNIYLGIDKTVRYHSWDDFVADMEVSDETSPSKN